MSENCQEFCATGGITLCPDGKHRWAYEPKLLKNSAILFAVFQ